MVDLTPVYRSAVVGRYAPSPTGRLHAGNLRTALLAEADVRQRGGIFILRMEDTDLPRNVAGAEKAIFEDLLWLGVQFDEGPEGFGGGAAGSYRQSERSDYYVAALRRLADLGLIYACTCSRKDLQSDASAPHGADGLIYPGTCGKLQQSADIDAILTQAQAQPGRALPACLRFRASALGRVGIVDEIHGALEWDLAAEIGDFVVLRRDGLWAYQFVCAIDDALMGITRVLRGEDLLGSTPRQAAIMKALNREAPVYRHVPLLLDGAGNRLSKRDNAASIDGLRSMGQTAAEVRRMLLSGELSGQE